jgi:hypothetical protein
MPYIRNLPALSRRRTLMGFGDWNDETPCASIPVGDPYRKPGNYCATPDGGYVTFNADGSAYTEPVASPPSNVGKVIGQIGGALLGIFTNKPVVPAPGLPVATGMSTTTKIALAGGALVVVALIARRK